MTIYSTEITSETDIAEGPIHHRLKKAYYLAVPYVHGDLLEVGCGEGRGVEILSPLVKSYTAIDKIIEIEDSIKEKFSDILFLNMHIPPFVGIQDNSFDTVVSFQVIEHIEDDLKYLQEIYRVLKPGGMAVITTPNINWTLTRNPWHVREYTPTELLQLCQKVFQNVTTKGISGNQNVWDYYEQNKKSVAKYKRLDIFGLEKRLPASILRIPYDILNKFNRNQLKKSNEGLVSNIGQKDFFLTDDLDKSLDLFYLLTK
ncbi:MAG: class I SAM-dependent methyltransferase [Chitinophagales bacterium]|nr:class I SAM-dependent methyltransferase [Chitinophagales bacterium]MCZ2393692.1 class I SAM-dependent methyltransferase [Chitinophagales bacterium]